MGALLPDQQALTLEVTEVTVRFGGVTALDGASLAVPPNQVAGVIGPNGAGKTTLFNAVCGLVRPAFGSITYGRAQLVGTGPHRLAQLRIARTLQGLGLWSGMTVLDNVQVVTIGSGGVQTTVGPAYVSSDTGPITKYTGTPATPPSTGIPSD